jgi:hypothetical protein
MNLYSDDTDLTPQSISDNLAVPIPKTVITHNLSVPTPQPDVSPNLTASFIHILMPTDKSEQTIEVQNVD